MAPNKSTRLRRVNALTRKVLNGRIPRGTGIVGIY